MDEKKLPEPKKASGYQIVTLPKSEISAWKPSDKAALAIVIGRVFDLQKQYGKTAAQLETMVDGYCWALKAYPVAMVIDGFREYITRKSDMPSPADIRAIIDPVVEEWQPDKAYYIKLQNIFKAEGPYGLSPEEYEYIRDYEAYMLGKKRS